jgi:hypothetical protein
MDPDPGDPKTSGSGSQAANLLSSHLLNFVTTPLGGAKHSGGSILHRKCFHFRSRRRRPRFISGGGQRERRPDADGRPGTGAGTRRRRFRRKRLPEPVRPILLGRRHRSSRTAGLGGVNGCNRRGALAKVSAKRDLL